MPVGLLTSQEARAVGTELFSANCAICHGTSGDGRGQRREGMNPPPANLTQPPWPEQTSGSRVYQVIRKGVPGTALPSWPMLNNRIGVVLAGRDAASLWDEVLLWHANEIWPLRPELG